MTTVNWTTIRALDGTQFAGFEELCAQLARSEKPDGSMFHRTGNPDAGVECYCTLPNGKEWGWQAKYFTDPLGSTQWTQLDRSVKTALEKHPNLERYFVCIPRDRSDGRDPRRTSAMDAWNQRVQKWQQWANQLGMQVEFVWWGSSELTDFLSQPRHVGRLYYWFAQQGFDQQWFKDRLDEALRAVWPRYKTGAHVELDITEKLKMFGRYEHVAAEVRSIASGIGDTLRLLRNPDVAAIDAAQLDLLRDLTAAGDQVLDEFTALAIHAAGELETDAIFHRMDAVETLAEQAYRPLVEIGTAHQERRDRGHSEFVNTTNPYLRVARDIERFRREIYLARSRLRSVAELFNCQVLLLSGVAGSGKTHLLCDFARQRLGAGAPVVLLMGQRFTETSEPWNQVLQHIGMHSSRVEQFVGAMEAAAQASNSRALVIIDALNEGRGIDVWPEHLSPFLARLEASSWIGVVFSVRATYEETIISEDVRCRAVCLTHRGFAGHEYEAVHTLFSHYGLEFPSSPLLHAEYSNPLYLTTVCEALSLSGATRVPRGLQGITDVFNLYFDAINKELSRRLDYNPGDNRVAAAVGAMAEQLADSGNGWLPRREAEGVVNQFLPGKPFSGSLYHGLVTAGVLIVDLAWGPEGQRHEVVFPAYERFTDHIVAKELLIRYREHQRRPRVWRWLNQIYQKSAGLVRRLVTRNKTEPRSPYGLPTWLSRSGRPVSQGVLEALCVQAPEQFGREFVRIVPQYQNVWGIGDAFLGSIVWRRLDAFHDDTRQVLNETIMRGDTMLDPYDSLMGVSAVPDHPLNARFLDGVLRQDEMPERDAWWSIYLDRSWKTEGPVDRIIDWASGASPTTDIDGEVVDLVAIGLAWMLAAPNRFVRDRATKALVSLLTGRFRSLDGLIDRFEGVDDPYVAERIYAVSYGVAMRSYDAGSVRSLARRVYAKVFEAGTPPPHILLRDYARGVIERAVHLDGQLEAELNLDVVRPPYTSQWPDVPDEDSIRELDARMSARTDGEDTTDRAWLAIRFSVMSGDFARYVIGTNFRETSRHWLSLTQDQDTWIPPETRKGDLIQRLDHLERTAWKEFDALSKAIAPVWISLDLLFAIDDEAETENPPVPSELDDAYCRFVGALSDAHYSEWDGLQEERPGLELSIIQRYILHRVVSLGWTSELFGDFDRYLASRDRTGRDAQKAERMGKKYQWIAFHEILALISDRYQYRGSWDECRYAGPWQIGLRDIDPSTVPSLKPATNPHTGPHQPTWWAPMEFDNWQPQLPIQEWLANGWELPRLECGMVVTEPSNSGVEWLNCYCYQERTEPSSPDFREDDAERRQIWARAVAFLVPEGSGDDFLEWVLSGAYWDEGRGPGIQDFNDAGNIFFGEHGWSPAYMQLSGGEPLGDIEWCFPPGAETKPARMVTASGATTAAGHDCSVDRNDAATFYLPSHTVARDCKLYWTGFGGGYVDGGSNAAAFDPSSNESGPGALLIRSDILEGYLSDQKLDLCWAIIGEKQSLGTFAQPHGWLSFQAAYGYRNGRAVGRHNATYHPEPMETLPSKNGRRRPLPLSKTNRVRRPGRRRRRTARRRVGFACSTFGYHHRRRMRLSI